MVFVLVLLLARLVRSFVRRTVLRHLREQAGRTNTLLDDSLLVLANGP